MPGQTVGEHQGFPNHDRERTKPQVDRFDVRISLPVSLFLRSLDDTETD